VRSSELHNLLLSLWAAPHDRQLLLEAAVLAAAFTFAALINVLLRRRITERDENLAFGFGGLQWLQMPLTALAVVLGGRAALKAWGGGVELLNLAVPLLTALAIVRIVVFALRRVFAPGGGLRATERFVAWTVWLGFAIHLLGFTPDFIAFLDGVGFDVGKDRISLLLILQAALTTGVTLLAALWAGSAIEARLMRAGTLDLNLRVMVAKLTRAALLLLAILIALPATGIDVTALSVFGGALGVGLGLGLQKVASNYLSGFIILMDRSVTIGDVITVDRYSGEITKMTGRYVVVRSPDGRETIIPNETMVASPVVNHSYTDRRVRLAVSVRMGRRADLDAAMRAMEEAGRAHAAVLREPAPRAVIKELTHTGITLELGVWVQDPGNVDVVSDLYADIWRRFKAGQI
jgi:small-conductance mechanosensitive channel